MKILLRYILAIVTWAILGACPAKVSALSVSHYTENSVLSSGRWVKISVDETGIYSISNSVLASWGFFNPSAVKIFGYGGAPVSTLLDGAQIDDLPQVPVLRRSNGILFYAQGPITWEESTVSGFEYKQYQHPYATAGYYFVTDRSDIEVAALVAEAATVRDGEVLTTFTDRVFHESELVSPGETGNYLLGEDFRYTTTQTFSFDLAGIVPGSTVKVLTGFGAALAGSRGKLSYRYNGNLLNSTTSDNISTISSKYSHVNTSTSLKQFTLDSENLDYSITFNCSGSVSVARLDYITINYTRSLDMGDVSQLQFRSPSDGVASAVYELSNCPADMHLWDVTTAHSPVEVECEPSGSTVRFSPSANGAREYVAFREDGSYPSPTYVGEVANQNIHAEPVPDMLIITPNEFADAARRIADLHEEIDSMRVLVVDHALIFNEFSSGTPDIMGYRKLAKMFYDRGTSDDGHKLGYILLMGRSLYDNRGITAAAQGLDYPRVLMWETDNGHEELSSYSTDDIVATLADGSSASNMHTYGLDVSIGRMPVKNAYEADAAVDKLVEYVTKQDFGSWKNNVIVLADDEDSAVHMSQAENGITAMSNYGGEDYFYNRVYIDAFTINADGSGNKYPDARRRLFKLLDDGALVFNYVGHGNPVSWTADGILTLSDINSGLYYNHIPFLYTATCDFSRLDAADVSGGELVFLNRRGGAVALFSTLRQVSISRNGDLTTSYGRQIFDRDEHGQFRRIGDICRLSKNAVNDDNKLRYILLGDPAMRLAYPTHHAVIETINGIEPTDDNMPEFKARQVLNVRGSIYDAMGNKDTAFDGAIFPTLYDAEYSVETHGNGQTGVPYAYDERSNKLAVVKDSVNGGEFEFSINIPAEISADNYRPALLSLYAYSNDGKEANGSNGNFYIYGYDNTVSADTIGPNIRMMYLNNSDFTDSGNVNESPLLVAEVYDASGLNFSDAGIGHQMSLLLDGVTTYSDVSSYFTPEIAPNGEEGAGGFIYYPLEELSEGMHSLRLKVWDTFANSSEQTITFNVINGLAPELYEVYATPSPARTEANFYLKHNRPEASIVVTVYVYNLMGQLVWSTTESGRSDMFTSFPITWNLTDMAGRRVPRGIYVYRAGISTDGVQETTASRKIAVTAEN